MENLEPKKKQLKAYNIIRETKIANFAKLANMLIFLFGIPEAFQKHIKKEREGKIVEMEFPSLQGGLTITLTSDKSKFNARWYSDLRPDLKPANISATIVINVKRKNVAKFVGKLIHKKSTILSLISLAPQLITRKIKIKGSFSTALAFTRIMMLGKGNI